MQNLNLTEDSNSIDSVIDDIEESQTLILKLNIAFYFTILTPPDPECTHCLSSLHQLCNCNKVLYQSELVASAVSVCLFFGVSYLSLLTYCILFSYLSLDRILPGDRLKVQRSVHLRYRILSFVFTMYNWKRIDNTATTLIIMKLILKMPTQTLWLDTPIETST